MSKLVVIIVFLSFTFMIAAGQNPIKVMSGIMGFPYVAEFLLLLVTIYLTVRVTNAVKGREEN